MEDRYNRKRSRSRPGRSSSLRMDADKLSGAPRQNNTLNPSQYNFCLHYWDNGLNATAAYRAAYPGVTGPTACTNAYRLLRNAEFGTFLTQELGDRWKALYMSGDEVVARVAMDARADPRLFSSGGKAVSPQNWPDEIANSVETLEFHENGAVKRVKFASKSAARRTILEMMGKLKPQAGESMDALAEAIRADLARGAPGKGSRM